MKIKTLSRSEWTRVLERMQTYAEMIYDDLRGCAGLLVMKRVAAPLAVPVLGQMITIADDGYSWLQIAPEGENWWLTVMFDRDGRIIQYYFDVSLKNEINGGKSKFTDLYLDVALLPDGRLELLDEDELDEALSEGNISTQEHALAVRTAQMLLKNIPENYARLERFCCRLHRELVHQIAASDKI